MWVSTDTLRGMNICGINRVLLPAFAVGVLVSVVTGNDLWGWAAGAVAVAAQLAVPRVRAGLRSCPIELPPPAGSVPRVESVGTDVGKAPSVPAVDRDRPVGRGSRVSP